MTVPLLEKDHQGPLPGALAPIQVEGWRGEEIFLVEILGVKDAPIVTPRERAYSPMAE